MNQQPEIVTSKGRRFACSPGAVLGIVVNEQERILLLSSPIASGGWEVINGALEAGETVLEGALREVAEEAGAQVQVRPLGVVHAITFHYDDVAQFMISINYLFEYLGGPVEPGDDMAGSAFRWWSLEELREERPLLLVPGNEQLWILERAVELFKLWRGKEVPSVPHPSGGRN